MKAEFKSQIKSVVKTFFGVCDDLDTRGIGSQINKTGDGALRDTVKAEIVLFLFNVLDSNQMLNEESVRYINDCLEYDFSLLNIEIARKHTLDTGIPQLTVLLPAFILVDSHLGGHTLSMSYVKTISFVTVGLLECKGASLQETVTFCRRIRLFIDMIDRALDCKCEFDPLSCIQDEKKSFLEVAIEVDEKINKYDAENDFLDKAVEALRKSIKEEKEKQQSSGTEKVDDSIEDYGKRDTNQGKTDALERMDQLIGLRGVKDQIHTILNVQIVNKKCAEYNIERQPIGMHMIFTGNPGTGKTTVARLVGEIYHDKGILSKGQFIEVSRAELVGKYVGHTAQIVKDIVKKAKGGVLFIDEAYSLSSSGNDFGQEAIDTLVKEMEDNRDDLVVIAAGYPELMNEFMESNPGLKSRFPITVGFPDYSAEDLLRIFKIFCSDNSFDVTAAILERVKVTFSSEVSRKKRNFGNARMVRNYFEKMMMNHANRLVAEDKLGVNDVTAFAIDDIPDRGIRYKNVTDQTSGFHLV